jgi:hypothetical protein
MIDDIQQAETAIKVGDTKTGFEILREVLAANPDSERAWWIMSGLVQREQRAACLEQVLRINPENRFAQDALDELLTAPPQPETKPKREIPHVPPQQESSEPSQENDEEGELQSWLHARGSKYYITILGPEHLSRALTDANLFSKVRVKLKKGIIPDQLLSEVQTIPISSLSSIKMISSGLLVFYQDGLSERSMRLNLADQTISEKVLGIIQERLGSEFIIKTQPIKTGVALAVSGVLSLGGAALAAYLFWVTQEVISGRAVNAGTVRSQFMINLIQSLGTGGSVLLGAFIFLIALGISALFLLKPPTTTILSRQE